MNHPSPDFEKVSQHAQSQKYFEHEWEISVSRENNLDYTMRRILTTRVRWTHHQLPWISSSKNRALTSNICELQNQPYHALYIQ